MGKVMKLTSLCFLSILLVLATILSAPAIADHTPSFSWQVRGDANYEQWIYDGDEPIALFESGTLDEPMQALMMFQLVEQPLLLRHLKLTPGGKPLVSAVQLYWKTGKVVTDVLKGLDVKGEGTDRLTVTFTVEDPWATIRVKRKLTVTYDNTLGSYVYDFQDDAVIMRPETLDNNATIRIEYCDPWFTGSPAPSQHFNGMWTGRYQQFAYESRDSGVVSIPHHHVAHSQKAGIKLKRDGIFAAVYEPDGNPAIQFMGKTADKTVISICPWAYDVHFGYMASPRDLYDPVTTHFRIFNCPTDVAKKLNDDAVIPSIGQSEWGGVKELPMYEPNGGFETAVSLEAPHEGDIDPWFWQPKGETGAVWDRTSGRSGSSSLKVEKSTDGIAEWYSMCEGQGYFALPWTPCKGYEVSCWVKTSDVEGAGSSIGIRYHVPNVPPEWPITRSERISGMNGWTKLTVTIGPPPKDTSIVSLHLDQVGSGTTWFDDIEVKMLK